jgi:glutamate synthase domain-containing protein 2
MHPSLRSAAASSLRLRARAPLGSRAVSQHDNGSLPDFIEKWSPSAFRAVGVGLVAGSAATAALAGPLPGAVLALLTAGYWRVGLRDLRQTSHSVLRNFPVLGHMRYILESIRPEIRQYFIESDADGSPFDRQHRSIAYQRAKNAPDTLPFGTRRNVYEEGYEFAAHSMWPVVATEQASRVVFGAAANGCRQPYSASLFNVSGMSYGALSENAVLALSRAAKLGNFYHNTGEGGMSRFHLEGGGDLVWNVGTGYFGCGQGTLKRVFDPKMFADNAQRPTCKMIELKLSQGAKPAHGGMLPRAKITPAIAEARGLAYPPVGDCNSPARHSAFDTPEQMMEFVAQLRELSGGKPVGFKLCVGRPEEFARLVKASLATGVVPDFVTVDGAEGGTGAAPPEFSNSVGMPMAEGLTLVHALLRGAGLRDRVRVIAAGKVLTGFSLVRTLAMGADVCNAARAMLFSIGCIQSFKCNTNTCPTGITTQDPRLMAGLVVPDKAERARQFHEKTVHVALEIVGALGHESAAHVSGKDVLRRVAGHGLRNFNEVYPCVRPRGARRPLEYCSNAHAQNRCAAPCLTLSPPYTHPPQVDHDQARRARQRVSRARPPGHLGREGEPHAVHVGAGVSGVSPRLSGSAITSRRRGSRRRMCDRSPR